MPVFRKLALLGAAMTMAAACAVAHAAEADSSEKKQALIRLLVRAGKNEEAAAAMRSLYPKGPPYGGELALEYYDVIGNTDSGWEEARAGLEKLVKAAPEDLSYQLMLAKHLSRRAGTRPRALQMFAALAGKPDTDRRQVLSEWRSALDKLERNSASVASYQEYLAVDPGNASIRDALASVQRAEATQLPWQLRDKASTQVAAGHPEEAVETLRRALGLDPRNAWVRFDLARLYQKQGDVQQGRDVMEAGLTAAPNDADMLYANALYVSLLGEPDRALRLLGKIQPKERSAAMKRLQRKMEVTLQIQQALAHAGKQAEAQAIMRQAEKDADKDAELVSIVANGWIDLNDPAHGVALMRPFAARPDAKTDAQIDYAKVLNRAEQYDELDAALKRLAAAEGLSLSDKEDLRYLHSSLASHRADNFRHQGKLEEARAVLTPALAQDPLDADMLMAMARVHEVAGEDQQARDIYQGILKRDSKNAGARRALDALGEKTLEVASRPSVAPSEHRAQGYVEAGMDYLSKGGGAPGISNIRTVELPVEAHMPVGSSGGRVFAQVDPVTADAGALQPSDLYDVRQYGKVLALSPGGITSAPNQSAQGKAVALGYEQDGLRLDIGSTPIGFPVSNVVGGMKWSHYTAVSGFSLDVSRRPLTSSLIAYAGARDPITGEIWGGVVSTGAGVHLGHDFGRLTLFFDPGYYQLTGTNVLSNTEIAVRTGFNWSFINNDDMRLTAGTAITYWNYRENERFYTFGMGGYYSPQKYYSLAFPFRWTGREERWSYLLQGSVSASVSDEKTMPFYPTSPALQAAAVANSGIMSPFYTGGPGNGTGFSFGGAVEYRFTPKLYGGALGQIDRSTYYTPNYAILYLRYMFDGQTGPVPFPPEPVRAYSRF